MIHEFATRDAKAPFENKVAVVIGGGKNIGRQVALEFARRGAKVAVADLDREAAEKTAAMIAALCGDAIGLPCDVASEKSLQKVRAIAEQELGSVDIVVNNAGLLSGGNPEDIPLEAWQQTMDINFFGMIRSMHTFLPDMLSRNNGHIVNTASFAGMYPFATSRMHYAASKAAVVSFTENLALYLLPKGINVSCLCPGPIMTTVSEGIRHYSDDYDMRAPGSDLIVQAPEETARILADGMCEGKILIPTHDELWNTLDELASSHDAFIRRKSSEFESGNSGRPQLSPQMREALAKD